MYVLEKRVCIVWIFRVQLFYCAQPIEIVLDQALNEWVRAEEYNTLSWEINPKR